MVQTSGSTITVNCAAQPNTEYEVHLAADTDGAGNGLSYIGKAVFLVPAAQPKVDFNVHEETPDNFMLVYDVEDPNTSGKFHFCVFESTTITPTAQEIMNCNGSGTHCGQNFPQEDQHMHSVLINCPLSENTTYKVGVLLILMGLVVMPILVFQ